MSVSETTLVEATSLILKGNNDQSCRDPQPEKEQATFRFAAAQRLFRRHTGPTASQPVLQRQNTNTIPSLPLQAAQPIYDVQPSFEQTRPGCSPERTSFACSFMRNISKLAPKPLNVQSPNSAKFPLVPIHAGCFILGPQRSLQPLDVTHTIKAHTENGSKAWYCRHDKLVVFDGVRVRQDADSNAADTPTNHGLVLLTRSSRGLHVARRNCRRETIRVDIPCEHCRDLLKRKEWVFQERMLECRVCKSCQDRCWKIWEEDSKK